MLDRLPDDACCQILERCDLKALKAARAACKSLSIAYRSTVQSHAFRQIPENMAALRASVWTEAPPKSRVLVAHSALVPVSVCAVSSEFIACSARDCLKVWSRTTGSCARRSLATASALVLHGPHIVAGLDREGLIKFFSCKLDAGHLQLQDTGALRHGTLGVTALCWATSETLISGGLDRALRVWQVEEHEGMAMKHTSEHLLAHRKKVIGIEPLPLRSTSDIAVRFVSASSDGTLHAWTLFAAGTLCLEATICLRSVLSSFALDSGGSLAACCVACCASGVHLCYFNSCRWATTRLVLPDLAAVVSGGPCMILATSAHRSQPISGAARSSGPHKELSVIDTSDPRQAQRLARWTQAAGMTCCAGHEDGTFVCGGIDGRLHVWELPPALQCVPGQSRAASGLASHDASHSGR